MYYKSAKCPNFTWFLPEKLYQIPKFLTFAGNIYNVLEFYMIFAPKMPKFYIIIARKKFYGGTCPSPPVSYAYASPSRGPHSCIWRAPPIQLWAPVFNNQEKITVNFHTQCALCSMHTYTCKYNMLEWEIQILNK